MANNTANVVAGLPNPTGGFLYGPKSAVLPTDAVAPLDETLIALGLVSDDGASETKSRDTNQQNDWSGGVVKTLQTSYAETYQVTVIEALKEDVQKMTNGDANVAATAATSSHGNQLAIASDGSPLPHKVFVFDMIDADGAAIRKVIGNGQVTDIGDVTYSASAVVGYQVTITAYKDSAGKFSYTYTDDGQKTSS